MPHPLEPKTIDAFQERNGKGEANVKVPTKTHPPKLTSIHTSNIDGKKQIFLKIEQTIKGHY